MKPTKRQHPPDDDKAAYQYEQYLKANDPNHAEYEYPETWDAAGVGTEPDFPGDLRDC